jgi:hypothetical protein
MERHIGGFEKWILTGSLSAALFAATCGLALGADLNLVCTGNSYGKDGPFPTVETVSFKTYDSKPAVITMPGETKAVHTRTIDNNAFQLRFAVAGVTGEYFYFTGDLFLIRPDGKLTRLVCKPS